MKHLLIIAWALMLTTNIKAQSCCTGGSASVNLGTESSGMTLSKGQFAFELNTFHWRFESMADRMSLANAIADVAGVSVAGMSIYYGLSDRWTLAANVPYLRMNSELYQYNTEGIMEINPSINSGLGDASVLGIYRLPLDPRWPQIGLLGGVELPTGYVNDQDAAVSASIGSESFDPIAGVLISNNWNQWDVTASANYKMTTQNRRGVDMGNFLNARGLVQYSFAKDACCTTDTAACCKVICTPSLFAGGSIDVLGTQKSEGDDIINTGYRRYFAVVGSGLNITDAVGVRLWAELPLEERLKGFQNESSVRIRTLLTWTF